MNAITDAFNRRRFAGRFRTAGRGIEMDTLLYQSTKGVQDDDDVTSTIGTMGTRSQQSRNGTGSGAQYCYAFQSGSCHRGNYCMFRHNCLICHSNGHGTDAAAEGGKVKRRQEIAQGDDREVRPFEAKPTPDPLIQGADETGPITQKDFEGNYWIQLIFLAQKCL